MLGSPGLTRSFPFPDAVGGLLGTGLERRIQLDVSCSKFYRRHLMSCSDCGTLITPEWPSAYFWPFLREGSSQFRSFVAEVFVLPAINDLLLEGPDQRQIYKSRPSVFRPCSKFRILHLRLEFR